MLLEDLDSLLVSYTYRVHNYYIASNVRYHSCRLKLCIGMYIPVAHKKACEGAICRCL